MTTDVMERPAKIAMNGVDVPTLLGTIGAVGAQPELAKFTFRANAEWLTSNKAKHTISFAAVFAFTPDLPKKWGLPKRWRLPNRWG